MSLGYEPSVETVSLLRKLVPRDGIDPSSHPYQGCVLPLN